MDGCPLPALDRFAGVPSPRAMGIVRRAGLLAALAAAPLGLAYRFALVYRARAGYPRQHLPTLTPADLGLPFESTVVIRPMYACHAVSGIRYASIW